MTDDELLQLLEQKTPEELTPDEIELLRQRLEASPQIQAALLDQVQMEGYLVATLGSVNLSSQEIVARAAREQGSSFSPLIVLLCIAICLPLAALTVGVLYNAVQPTIVAKNATNADRSPLSPPTNSSGNAPAPSQPETAASDSPVQPREAPQPTPAPAAKTPEKAKTPWHDILAFTGELPRFEDQAFIEFDREQELPRRVDLLKWFEAVPSQNHRINEVRTQYGWCGTLEGLARLKAPWTEDSALKLALENHNRLQLHFYHGDRGVTLVYYQDEGNRWAAYATTRVAGTPLPTTTALTATDDDRGRHTEVRHGGPLEIRYHRGQIILSRGDIVLLAAPLAGLPTDVYFQGRAQFQGLSLIRTQDSPALAPDPPRPIVFDTDQPAELEWTSTKPAAAVPVKQADGSLRLAADKATERAAIFTPVPRVGLHEYIFELDDISPGSGIYLGYENGRYAQVLRFYRNRQAKEANQLIARISGWDDDRDSELPLYSEKLAPNLLPHCWVKMVVGCGQLRWWLSSDGIHWGQPEMGASGIQPEISTIGLQVVAKQPDVHLTLRRIVLRELPALTALASAELREQAVASPQAESFAKWQAEIEGKRPTDVSAPDWQRACALRTLAAGTKKELGHALLELLLDAAVDLKLPLEEQLAVLSDANLLTADLRDGHPESMRTGIPSRILQLGLAASRQQGLPAWSSVRRAAMLLRTNTWLQAATPADQSIRSELIQRTYAGKPAELLDFCRLLAFYKQDQQMPLAAWAATQARRELPGRGGEDSISRAKEAWRHPLIEELSKEAYNALTELQAVLDGEAWDDGAQLVTSFDPEIAPGVVPYVKDRALLTSLPVAIELTLRDYPELRDALGTRYAALAKLRLGQAMAAGNAAAVELAAVQFAETEAAAEAHRWLGDRALSSGWFDRALGEYRQALTQQPGMAGELGPRIRLAAAMLGRDAGSTATEPVSFGELQMSAAEFESLVAEMRSRGGHGVSPAEASSGSLPKPTGFQVHNRSRLDGNAGNSPAEEVGGRKTNQFKVPWADRQIATAIEGDILYVSNRFQLAAYNLTSGQRLWQSAAPPGTMQKSQAWACIPMQPLLTQQHIFARQLYGSSPTLVCLEKSSGKLVWATEPLDKETLISDPLLVQGQLVALTVAGQGQQEGILRWTTFDSGTGEVQAKRDVVRLRNTWLRRQCCEVLALDDSLVAVLGGMTVSVSPQSGTRWVRKQVVLPTEEEPRWILQMYQRPLLAGNRLYISQPGVRAIDCLDPGTGRRHWTCTLPEAVGIIGLAGPRLIVRTESGITALDSQTGQFLWEHPVADLHSFHLASEQAVILAQREPASEKKRSLQTRLVWLDPASGTATASTVLPNLNHEEPRLGPLIPYKDRLFTFFGRGLHDPLRDFIELAPQGKAEMPPAISPSNQGL